MKIFALSDFHLSFATPGKSMEVFGEIWRDWTKKIYANCHDAVSNNDLLLIAGDISWASTLEQAMEDLRFIASLPGQKIILKGNHDFWWPSYSKLTKALPEKVYAIQNNSFEFGGVSIGGTRLWDSPEYSFSDLINLENNQFGKEEIKKSSPEDEKIFERELLRLEMSLNTMKQSSKKVIMTHYPPISSDLKDSKASKILEAHDVKSCVFGHLHSVKKEKKIFGSKNEVNYHLTSCDYLDFKPIEIFL